MKTYKLKSPARHELRVAVQKKLDRHIAAYINVMESTPEARSAGGTLGAFPLKELVKDFFMYVSEKCP